MRSLRSSAQLEHAVGVQVADEADERAALVAVVRVVVGLVRELVRAEGRARQALLAPERRS
jgi:hypothetical protein